MHSPRSGASRKVWLPATNGTSDTGCLEWNSALVQTHYVTVVCTVFSNKSRRKRKQHKNNTDNPAISAAHVHKFSPEQKLLSPPSDRIWLYLFWEQTQTIPKIWKTPSCVSHDILTPAGKAPPRTWQSWNSPTLPGRAVYAGMGEVQDEGGRQLEGETGDLRRGRTGRNVGRNLDSFNAGQWAREMDYGFEEGREKKERSPLAFLWTITTNTFNLTDFFSPVPAHSSPMHLPSSLSPNLSLPLALRICFGTTRKLILPALWRSLGKAPLAGQAPQIPGSYSFETPRKFQRASQRGGHQLS